MASVVYGSWLVVSEYFLWKHSGELERQVQTEQITDPDAIWAKWTELSKGNPSSLLLHGSRRVVKQKFLAEADHVIATYRDSDSLPVYEKDWERARTMLARALAVDPDDSVRGKLRLVEGHIARINGGAHSSLAELNLAVDKFNSAQQLMPKSPDPELGLARVYVYGLKDIDRAYQALQQAEQRGYHLRNRERVQLRRWLPRTRRPAVVGFAKCAWIATGEGSDPARRRRLQSRAGPVSGRGALRQCQRWHRTCREEPGEREFPAAQLEQALPPGVTEE